MDVAGAPASAVVESDDWCFSRSCATCTDFSVSGSTMERYLFAMVVDLDDGLVVLETALFDSLDGTNATPLRLIPAPKTR